MSAAPRFFPNRILDTVTFEFEEQQFTISGEVDRSGFVHEAVIMIQHLDGPGCDPIDCTENFRKSKYYTNRIIEFISTYDWVSARLAEKYSGYDKL